MALLSKLVRVIAEVEGMDDTQVGWIARHLREAGYISQAGRGRGAAHMIVRDATNLLIGVNASDKPKDAASVLPIYRDLVGFDERYPSHPPDDTPADEDDPLEQAFLTRKPFGAALEILLGMDPDALHGITISFHRPAPMVRVAVGDFSDPDEPEMYYYTEFRQLQPARTDTYADRSDITTISDKTLVAIAQALHD